MSDTGIEGSYPEKTDLESKEASGRNWLDAFFESPRGLDRRESMSPISLLA
jgi:hypothetical protein